MNEFEVVVSGVGRFYTDDLKAAEYLVKLVKQTRGEGRMRYYGDEKELDVGIRKRQVAMVQILEHG